MRYLSVCSGIEAATVAWHPLGWIPAAFSEIDKAARRALAHHYPNVPLHGDFTTIGADDYGAIDLLVGGTPCQDFSIAGLRAGVAGERGNLTLEFVRLAARKKPRWILWENVPGVLSIDGGRTFGTFLGGLAELGYGFAYRILDAQYAGLAQRRERVFVVGYLGDWRPPAAVLFERESLLWDSPPRREAGQGVARPIAAGSPGSSGYRNDADTADNLIVGTLQANGKAAGSATQQDAESGLLVVAFGGNNTAGPIDVATALNSHGGPHGRLDFESETFLAVPLRGKGVSAAALQCPKCGDGIGNPGDPMFTLGTDDRHAIAFSVKDHGADAMVDLAPTLRAGGHHQSHANGGVMPAIAFDTTQITHPENRSNPQPGGPCHPLAAQGHPPAVAFSSRTKGDDGRGYERPPQHYVEHVGAIDTVTRHSVATKTVVRRLTPTECERLQGFPDGYTQVPAGNKPTADGPRYKQLGSSIAVPVIRWIGERIAMVERLTTKGAA